MDVDDNPGEGEEHKNGSEKKEKDDDGESDDSGDEMVIEFEEDSDDTATPNPAVAPSDATDNPSDAKQPLSSQNGDLHHEDDDVSPQSKPLPREQTPSSQSQPYTQNPDLPSTSMDLEEPPRSPLSPLSLPPISILSSPSQSSSSSAQPSSQLSSNPLQQLQEGNSVENAIAIGDYREDHDSENEDERELKGKRENVSRDVGDAEGKEGESEINDDESFRSIAQRATTKHKPIANSTSDKVSIVRFTLPDIHVIAYLCRRRATQILRLIENSFVNHCQQQRFPS